MIKLGRVFHGKSGEFTLSEEMKRFSELVQMKRIDFIKARLIKKTALGAWQPIPITREEANNQKAENQQTFI